MKRRYPDGERYAIRMRIVDGELHYKQLRLRADAVDDAKTAIEQLLAGRVVWLLQRGALVTTVQRAIEGRL